MAYKLICAMRTPDHSTIAEFRRRHEREIAELFDDLLGLCREAGLVSVGVMTIDGTKIKADASMDQNRSYRDVVTEILREAEETDRREDELYGDDRGDELPEQLGTAEGRRAALEAAKRRLAERKGRAISEEETVADLVVGAGLVLGRAGRRAGRREWFRVASPRAGETGAGANPARSGAIGRTVCFRPSGAWRRTTGSTWPLTRPTSGGARPHATRLGVS